MRSSPLSPEHPLPGVRVAFRAALSRADNALGDSVIAARLSGHPTAEQLMRDSFSGTSFFEGLRGLGSLPPEPLAAFLAEHLRAHFSGQERGGGVRVVEHPDRFQLIFDGRGQEPRRRLLRVSSGTIHILVSSSGNAMSTSTGYWSEAISHFSLCKHETGQLAQFGINTCSSWPPSAAAGQMLDFSHWLDWPRFEEE